MEINKVYNEDCLETMKRMKDNSIDLILTDPPYGIGIDGQKESVNINNPKANRKQHDFKGWDNETPSIKIFKEMFRVSKHQIIWGANYFTDKLEKQTKGWLIWDKGQRGLTMSDCELCYTSFDVPTRIFTYNRVEIQVDGSVHPTQKPLKLFSDCVDFALKRVDVKTIYDPFGGSGTTGVVCEQKNIDYIISEKEEDYYKTILHRIEEARGTVGLFGSEEMIQGSLF